jgi:hypothetical protein
MTVMQFDFSALDAELESLGRPPEDALSLARHYAPLAARDGAPGSGLTLLDEIDRTLAALEGDNGELGDASDRFGARAEPRASTAWQTVPQYEDSPRSGARALKSVAPEAPLPPTAQPVEEAVQAVPTPPLQPATLDSQPPAASNFGSPAEPRASTFGSPAEPRASTFGSPAEPRASTPPAPESVPPTQERRQAALTQSQEIVLPDPIARAELSSESGELRLDGDDPSSGSFELPETPTEPRIAPEEVAPAEAAGAAPLLPFDEVQDALEGSQPLMLDSARAAARNAFHDRDPDAEFDALLSEATDPRGIPTGARTGSSGEIDTDDLLRGLEGDALADEEVSPDELAAAEADEPHEAELLTRSLFEDAGEATEINDRNALGVVPRAPASLDADAMLADELDSGELEIVMEDDDSATLAPPPAQQLSKGPPPPPPPGTDKRPSLLGRLFHKREGDE